MSLTTNKNMPPQDCEVLRAFHMGGGKVAEVGETVTLLFHDARLLESAGKVNIVTGKKNKAVDPVEETDKKTKNAK